MYICSVFTIADWFSVYMYLLYFLYIQWSCISSILCIYSGGLFSVYRGVMYLVYFLYIQWWCIYCIFSILYISGVFTVFYVYTEVVYLLYFMYIHYTVVVYLLYFLYIQRWCIYCIFCIYRGRVFMVLERITVK